MMTKKIYEGIDLSRHNVVTNWDRVKDQVDFIILRAGGNYGGYYKDSKFEQYYAACKKLGIPVGAYYDAGKELWCNDGKEYAQHFLKLISGKTFEYPVYIDIEVVPKKYRKANTGAAVAFCEEMEKNRYFTGIYGSDINTFKEQLILDVIEPYSLWVARYGKKPSYVKNYAMWQYTSKGAIVGIKGNVDKDQCYTDFPKIMKGVHLNGY